MPLDSELAAEGK